MEEARIMSRRDKKNLKKIVRSWKPEGMKRRRKRRRMKTRIRIWLLFYAFFLLDLFFDSEDGSNMFFETSVDFQRTTRRYIPTLQD
jgi:hypothetical protein